MTLPRLAQPATALLCLVLHAAPVRTSNDATAAARENGVEQVVTVGANVQVSASMPDRMHTEGMIAADPSNAARLIVCSMFLTEETGQSVAVYQSEDGGAHWQRTFETPSGEFDADPACAFGPDGVAHLTMMPLTVPSMAKMRLPLWRSDDGGRTWHSGGVTGGMDRESIAIDATGGPYNRRIYLHGSTDIRGSGGIRRTALTLYASSDGGRTFGRPVSWASLGRGYIFASGSGVVLSDGRWLTVFMELTNYFDGPVSSDATRLVTPPPEPEDALIRVIASDDGGDTLREPVTVSGEHVPNDYVRLTNVVPAIAADATNGPFRDRIYVAWLDSRRGASDVFFSYSADRGQTWSTPIVINDNSRWSDRLPNQLMPAIAVNRDGIVAVTWLDRRNASDGLGWDERIRVSTDGGETFLPSVVVAKAAAQFNGREQWPLQEGTKGGGTPLYAGGVLHLEAFAPRFLYVPGDYATLAADANGVFHSYWIDNRSGWHQVWTAPVHVAGKAVRNGSEALAALDDLTAATTLKRIAAHYDRATSTASITVRLENTSHEPIDGPFTLRLITLDSDVADATASSTTNGISGPGAIWVVPSVHLDPGAQSDPVTLSFVLRDVHPFVQGHTDRFDLRLVKFDVRVLGHATKRRDDASAR